MAGAYPGRLASMATVPLQHQELAVAELERTVRELGMPTVQIRANVEGVQLDHPGLIPFFRAAEKLGVVIFVHPYYVGAKGMLERYYLTNLVGNPLDTVLAVSHLIFGGVLDKVPGLKFCFAHGGGYLPYSWGAWNTVTG